MKLSPEPTKAQVESWLRRVRADAKRSLREIEDCKVSDLTAPFVFALRTMVEDITVDLGEAEVDD